MRLNNLAEIADIVLLVEIEMRKLGIWEEFMPNDMQSSLPFACDKLSLQQWLQWIFIPRVAYYVERNMAFPHVAKIAPYAEEVLVHATFRSEELIRLLERFDRLVAGDE